MQRFVQFAREKEWEKGKGKSAREEKPVCWALSRRAKSTAFTFHVGVSVSRDSGRKTLKIRNKWRKERGRNESRTESRYFFLFYDSTSGRSLLMYAKRWLWNSVPSHRCFPTSTDVTVHPSRPLHATHPRIHFEAAGVIWELGTHGFSRRIRLIHNLQGAEIHRRS